MKKIAIVYHSGYGHTARQAEAVLAGAQAVEGVHAKLYSVETLDDARWQELGDADAGSRRFHHFGFAVRRQA